jgi:hypothetical protein
MAKTQTFLEFTLSNDTRNAHTTRRLSTETKAATKTTELIAYVVAVLAVIVTALVVGDSGNNTADPFSANDAMRYIVFLTIGYMIARGLAKSGSRDAYDAD